jgi:hypothetical protein
MPHGRPRIRFLCTYCGKPAATVDHCPPKGLFPSPLPSTLQTVPACLACNSEASKDEEYFRALLMLTEAGETPAGKQLREGKAGRAIERNGLRQRIAANVQWEDVRTEVGVALGRQLVVKPEYERIERVAIKIARGLFLRECGTRIPGDTGLYARFLVNHSLFDLVAKHLPHLRLGQFQWPGIFDYKLGLVSGRPGMSMWVMRFYETAFFMVMSAPRAKIEAWQAEAGASPQMLYVPADMTNAS